MEPTPLEQEVVAEAMKFTFVLTVLPLVGLVTVTPANAEIDAQKIARHRGECFLMSAFLLSDRSPDIFKLLKTEGIAPNSGQETLIVPKHSGLPQRHGEGT